MKEVLRLDHGVLTHFPASAGRNKPALILCPGGGYEYCSIREGAPVARAFARDGVEAFVLEYDCTEVPLGVKPLHTLSASVAWVREHAAQLGIAADRIAIGGFSAGAHLAGLLAATWHTADWWNTAENFHMISETKQFSMQDRLCEKLKEPRMIMRWYPLDRPLPCVWKNSSTNS